MLRKVAGGGRWRAAVEETGTPQAALRESGDTVWRLVDVLRRRGWTGPALATLEATRPLAWPAAQLLWMAQPALALFIPRQRVGRWAQFLEDPAAVQQLIDSLERDG